MHTPSPALSHSSRWQPRATTRRNGRVGAQQAACPHTHSPQVLCTVLPIRCPNISLPMVPSHSLDPDGIAPPQHSFFIFSPACSPSLFSVPFTQSSNLSEPTFSLVSLRAGDLLLKQRCAEFWGNTQRHVNTQSQLFSCWAKSTWKVGVLEAHDVLQLQLSTWQDKSCWQLLVLDLL